MDAKDAKAVYDRQLPAVRREPLVGIAASLAQACQKYIDRHDGPVQSGEMVSLVSLIVLECQLRHVRIPAPKAFQRGLQLLCMSLADGGVDEQIEQDDVAAGKQLQLVLQRLDALFQALDGKQGGVGDLGHAHSVADDGV